MQNADRYPQPERAREREAPKPGEEILSFNNGNQLVIDRRKPEETLQVIGKSGDIEITIKMTENGTVIRLSGAEIQLKASKKIEIDSPELELKADKNIRIHSKGNLQQTIEGDYHEKVKGDAVRTARIQHFTANLGNVNIKANDDVRLDGERIKLNCTE